MTDIITILIVDSHAAVRSGLRALIETVPEMMVIGDTHDVETAVFLAQNFHPDIIILDMMSENQNGIDILRTVRRASYESKILILTDNNNSDEILNAVQAGARGYLLKDPLSADIASAIHDIMAGKLILHYGIAKIIGENLSQDPDKTISDYSSALLPEFDSYPSN